jgi:hypothetical protein
MEKHFRPLFLKGNSNGMSRFCDISERGLLGHDHLGSIVPDNSVLETGEWQLLLGAIALPVVLIGA